MDESIILDEEVIADSEEENERPGGPTDDSFLRHSSPFSAFSTTNHAHKPNTTLSSISNFTVAGPSAIADYSSRIDSSERGRAKESEIDTSFTSFRGTHGNLDDITSSIADRAKTRQRPKTSSTSAVLDVIELTSEDDDELALKPPKAKPKPKPKPRPKLTIKLMPKAKDKSANEANTSIQPNPPQPEEAAPKPPRPRPRPRPRKPPVPEPETAGLIAPPPPPTPTPPTELPIATSSPRPWPMVSQLPPSDPPLPSMGTAYNDDPNTRAPPIEALFEGPLSSPNSLFSDGGKRMKKKKTNPSESDREIDIDELAPSSNPSRRPFAGQAMYDSSPHGMPPPPTFFAGSSSSSIGRNRNHEVPGAFTPPPQDGPDIVDLTMLPPTLIPPPKPKPKKPKKTVDMSIYDENNFGEGGMIILDEDNRDDDFDPREEGSSKKKKTKAKPKEKSTKSKSKAKAASDETSAPAKGKVVEVLLDPRPPSRGKGKAKADDKGKKKDTSDKEAFKSREFIEDSDDELDCVRILPSGGYSAGTANTPSAVTSSKVQTNTTATTSAPVSKAAAASSAKAKEPSPRRSLSPLSDLDTDISGAGPSTTKRSASGAKKRKSIVDSDGEDDEFAMAVDESIRVTPASSSAKKRKTDVKATKKKSKGDGGKKGRNVVLSDDDEEEKEPAAKSTKPPKASKQSKKVIHDDDEEAQDKPDEQQLTPEEIKENVVPPTTKPITKPPIAATPKPSHVPKPSLPSTNGEHKTPLYARYEIAPRKSSLPMSELIRRANSMPGSPFPATPSAIGPSRLKGLSGGRTPTAYSPMLKSSRSLLSKIAPLHPNRRTPPPPPPPPPPRKKTKKELELEEKWEEEMVEEVGGVEAWAVLGDHERREMRKAKWARELGGWDD